MAQVTIAWVKHEPLSMRAIAAEEGFDIARLYNMPADAQAVLRKALIKKAIDKISETWYGQTGRPLSGVKKGVYVIGLSHGLAVQYKRSFNPVVYIGRGDVSTRLKAHLQTWMIDFSASMQKTAFRLHITEARAPGPGVYFKDFETHLLNTFEIRNGEKPLVNKINGRMPNGENAYTGGWDSAIRCYKKQIFWAIKPLKSNRWFKEMSDPN